MALEKRPNAEPIRGYRLLERLGSGGFGEVWKCEAPGGIHKAIKFVYGNLESLEADARMAEEELRAFQLIKSIRHPFLLSIDRVESVQGELVIVSELADLNLQERWQQARDRGLPGIPRDELLGYLREAAEVLDLLNQKFDLQHLDVKPHNLFLVSNHVKVADFGLVNCIPATRSSPDLCLGASPVVAVTPLYAAPEVFHGKLSRHCDQYSLALVYQELLTGTLPYRGKSAAQLLFQHTQGEPDLCALADPDRAVVARALAKDPSNRFPSCLEFVRALGNDRPVAADPTDKVTDLVTTPGPQSVPTVPVVVGSVRTGVLQPPALPAGVLDGYRFLDLVGNSPLLETWRVEGAGGLKKLAHLLYGFRSPETKLREAVARLRSVHHPALLGSEIAHVDRGRVLLVTDAFRETVRDRYQQWVSRKQPGIPRAELIDYLRAAAEVLDYLYQQHGVQHLNINPRNLVLDHGWLRIAEFGYAQVLWLPEGHEVARRNLRYAAPELVAGHAVRGCDQYSLALVYAEMLTGHHPYRGRTPMGAAVTDPDLSPLPDRDREVIARALRPDPRERWPSSTEMLLALEGAAPQPLDDRHHRSDAFVDLLRAVRDLPATPTGPVPGNLNAIIAELITAAGWRAEACVSAPPELSTDDDALHYRFQAGIPLGTACVKLEEYARELGASITRQDEGGCVMQLDLPTTFWENWIGRQPGLDIEVELSRLNPMSATPIEVRTRVRSRHCSATRGRDLVRRTGTDLLDALQQRLLVNAEKRVQDRVLWPHPLRVTPVCPDGRRDEAIECRGKDLSLTGIGFYLPHELTTAEVVVELPNAARPPFVTIPATLVRAKRCADGWYEVGAVFRLPTLLGAAPGLCAASGR
jgi:serine/threonine protein kinase